MSIISVRLNERNLFVEISSKGVQDWTLICFGKCKENSSIYLDDKYFEIGGSEAFVTFKDRKVVLSMENLPDWEKDNPNGAINITFDEINNEDHLIQISAPVPENVYELIKINDFTKNDVLITLNYDDFNGGHGRSAYAFASKTTIHFLTK